MGKRGASIKRCLDHCPKEVFYGFYPALTKERRAAQARTSWKARDRIGGGMLRTPESMLSTINVWIHEYTSSTSHTCRVAQRAKNRPPTGRTATPRFLTRVLRRFWEGFWGKVLRRVLRRGPFSVGFTMKRVLRKGAPRGVRPRRRAPYKGQQYRAMASGRFGQQRVSAKGALVPECFRFFGTGPRQF